MKFYLNFSCDMYILGREGGLNCEVTPLAEGGAAPQHHIALLAHKPHPTPDDASGADCA